MRLGTTEIILIVVLALVLFGAYYLVCFRANELIEKLLLHLDEVGAAVRGGAYPLYLIGRMGQGDWLAIALVIFTIWRPNVGILSSILFGGLYILYLFIPTGTNLAVKELYKMLPYVVTVVVLVISSLRNNMEKQPPASLGLSYFREER